MTECIFVGLGGFVGAVLRYLISQISVKEPFAFPIKTFLINVIGAFAIGVIVAVTAKNSNTNPKLILFLKTGVCGGFTTFSTFALETSDLIKTGHITTAILYVLLSVIIGIIAVFSAQKIIDII